VRLEDQVASLDLCKRLKELNVKQESYFEWLYRPDLDSWSVSPRFKNQLGYSAFTSSELGEMLPYSVDDGVDFYYPNYTKHPKYYRVQLLSDGNKMLLNLTADTESELRAKMLIYLIENGLVNV